MTKTIAATLALGLTALLGLAACGGSADPDANATPAATVDTVEPTVTTEAPATTKAPTTTAKPTTTKAPTTTTVKPECRRGEIQGEYETRQSCDSGHWVPAPTVRPIVVDQAVAITNAQVHGVRADATCAWPGTVVAAAAVQCTVVNDDLSEGTWTLTLNPDMSITDPVYVETKARPLTPEDCPSTPEQGQFQKDSTAYTGQCLHFWGNVFQFDANTGPCSFLGKYGSSPWEQNYEFSDAIIRVDGGANCGLLGPVVDGSFVEVWAKATGTESYSTTIGGTNTYTVFEVVNIAVYK